MNVAFDVYTVLNRCLVHFPIFQREEPDHTIYLDKPVFAEVSTGPPFLWLQWPVHICIFQGDPELQPTVPYQALETYNIINIYITIVWLYSIII